MQSGNHPTRSGIAHDFVRLPRPAHLPAYHRAQQLLKDAMWWGVRIGGIAVAMGVSYVLGAFSGGWLA